MGSVEAQKVIFEPSESFLGQPKSVEEIANYIDADIAANIFSMQEEKDYFLYINDRFGQDDATSELYIDLKKVSIS